MCKNRNGFTLAEVLLSLSVMMIALSILVPIMEHLSADKWENDWSIHQFTQTIQRELNSASSITTAGTTLSFTNRAGDTVKIEPYQNMIRRRVNNQGHEILLYQVEDISFSVNYGVLKMDGTLEGGDPLAKTFFIPL